MTTSLLTPPMPSSRFLLLRLLLIVSYIVASTICHSAVLVKNKQWQKGTTLNVVFLDGSQQLQRLVSETAPLWLEDTSLSFQFYASSESAPKLTHIRISFKLHSGSQLGNHKDYTSRFPTMNLFDLTSNQISDSGARRLILHEFGHALGLEHEYRNQYWPYGVQVIQPILNDCYPKMEIIGYSIKAAMEHCKEINSPISSKTAKLTAYDERSIMNYPISFELPSGVLKHIKPAVNLSVLDKHAVQQWYGN